MNDGPSSDIQALVGGMDALSLDPKTEQWLAAKENCAYSQDEVQIFLKNLPQEELLAIKAAQTFLAQQDREIHRLLDTEQYLLNTLLQDHKKLQQYVAQMLKRLRQNDCSEQEPSEASMIEDQYCLNAINMALIASQLSFGKSKLILNHCTRLPRVFLLSDQFKGYREDILHLELSSNALGYLPEEIEQLINLEHLSVYGCSLKALPERLGKLSRLTVLDVSKNAIDQLPNEIGALNNLQRLNCSGNKLKELPESFWALTALEHLDLSSNKFCMLPPYIAKLHQLKCFNISFNKLKQLPAQICELVQLSDLNVMHNKLQTLPIELGKLKALRKLNLATNQLDSLDSIQSLNELDYLDVSRNKLSKHQIFQMKMVLKKTCVYKKHDNLGEITHQKRPKLVALDAMVTMRGGSLRICIGTDISSQNRPSLCQGMPILGVSVDDGASQPAIVHQYESFKPLKISDEQQEKSVSPREDAKKKKDASCIIN